MSDTNGNGTAVAKVERQLPQGADQGGSIAAFTSQGNFEAAQRMAKALAASSMVPKAYQGNLADSLVALELAARTGASVIAIMQSVDVIHGRPAFRASFKIGAVNSGGRFRPLKYETKGSDPSKKDYAVRAWTTEKGDDEPLYGPWITWELVTSEGWDSKAGSKWKTMPQKMFMYRAGSWWVDTYAPEITLGMTATTEELEEATWEPIDEAPVEQTSERLAALKAQVQELKAEEIEDEPAKGDELELEAEG